MRRYLTCVLLTAVLGGCDSPVSEIQRTSAANPVPEPRAGIDERPASAPRERLDACKAENPDDLIVSPRQPLAIAMIEHDPIDVELSFTARLREQAKDDSGSLRLRLVHADREIERLTFSKDPTLKDGEETTVKVEIEDVDWPGRHRATLCLRVEAKVNDDQGNTNEIVFAKKLDLVVDVRTKPKVVALQDSIELNLIRCWGPGCWLAEAIVPEATALESWPVEIRNDSLSAVAVEPQVRLRRNEKEASWPLFALRPVAGQEQLVTVGATSRYELTMTPSELRAGTYDGSLAFVARPHGEEPWRDRQDERGVTRNRTETPVEAKINVRAGILGPIILLAAGIVAGRFNRQISTPEAQARLKLMNRWVDLRRDVEQLSNGRPQGYCERQLAEIELQLNDPSVDNEVVGRAISTLERQVGLFRRFDSLSDLTDDESIWALIGDAWLLVEQGDFIGAERKRLAIEQKIHGFAANAAFAKRNLEVMQNELAEAGVVDPPRLPAPTLEPWRPARIMSWLAGTRVASLRVQYLYLQPAATLLLLVGLVALGLYTFYSGPENSTFGAALIDDYFPLFLWGFGSNVLAMRLQDITFTR